MKRLAVIALAAAIAATGAVAPASAALSDRDATAWRLKPATQVAARGGERGARNDGGRGRDARRDRKNDSIWRIRGGKHGPFFFFRHGHRQDCSLRKENARNAAGKLVFGSIHTCE